MYRNIIERSIMLNNDEVIFYTENKLGYTDPIIKTFGRSGFDSPRLVLSREAFKEEGLNFTFKGCYEDEKVGRLTYLLDAYFKIKSVGDWYVGSDKKITPSRLLAFYIGSAYYDCMSSGCSHMELSILRYLCEHESINLDEKVYPSKVYPSMEMNQWLTIRDFIEEIKNNKIIDFNNVIKLSQREFPTFDFKLLKDLWEE